MLIVLRQKINWWFDRMMILNLYKSLRGEKKRFRFFANHRERWVWNVNYRRGDWWHVAFIMLRDSCLFIYFSIYSIFCPVFASGSVVHSECYCTYTFVIVGHFSSVYRMFCVKRRWFIVWKLMIREDIIIFFFYWSFKVWILLVFCLILNCILNPNANWTYWLMVLIIEPLASLRLSLSISDKQN